MSDTAALWYVAPQRLCNFGCTYCVSTGDWSKSSSQHWWNSDQQMHEDVLDWIAERPYRVRLRLGTLGEPFATAPFVKSAFAVSELAHVEYVELLTNASLLTSRLPRLKQDHPDSRVSLWITWHPSEIGEERFLANVEAAEALGLPFVCNFLVFPQTASRTSHMVEAARNRGWRINIDPGYNPNEAAGTFGTADQLLPADPLLREKCGGAEPAFWDFARRHGVSHRYLRVLDLALNDPTGRLCHAGGDALFIGIDGQVFPCSRYYELGIGGLGRVGHRAVDEWRPTPAVQACRAPDGCANKEDHLNLTLARPLREPDTWTLGLEITPQGGAT